METKKTVKTYLTPEGEYLPITPAVRRRWIAEEVRAFKAGEWYNSHIREWVEIDRGMEVMEMDAHVVWHNIGRTYYVTDIVLGAEI